MRKWRKGSQRRCCASSRRKVGLADGGERSIKRGCKLVAEAITTAMTPTISFMVSWLISGLWLLDDLPGNSTLFFVLAGQSASMPARRAV